MREGTKQRKPSSPRDFPYFRRLWRRTVFSLLAVSLTPLFLVGGGMYYYATATVKKEALDSLQAEVLNHRESIEEFLSERISNLRMLADNLGLSRLIQPGSLDRAFATLQQESAYFTDLGIIDDQGQHLAYVGPYDLMTKNYKREDWFQAVMQRGTYVSDVFMGFRDVPHFVIAIQRSNGHKPWILRATVNTAYFCEIVSEMGRWRTGDGFLINQGGLFQTVPRSGGTLMEPSEFKDLTRFAGVKLEEQKNKLQAMGWLKNVPWLCVVRVDRDEVFGALNRLRNVGIFVFGLGGMLILLTVLLTTNYLVSRLEVDRLTIRSLDHQLRHAGRLATLSELASGFIREISETTTNIDATAQWIRNLVRKESIPNKTAEEIDESIGQIAAEVARSREISQRLLRITRPTVPAVAEVEVHDLLDEVLDLLGGELRNRKIRVEKAYCDPLPVIRSDPYQLHQVFLHLVLNAMDAVQETGEICLKTRRRAGGIEVTVTDTGPGIPEESREAIFDAFFTTKPMGKGTGLGLSNCQSIVQKLGGRILVESEPGQGASFVVELPDRFVPPDAETP